MKVIIVLGGGLGAILQWSYAQASTDIFSAPVILEYSIGALLEGASSILPSSEFYLPFGLGENASDLDDDPMAGLRVNIIWSVGIFIFLWFAIKIVSTKVAAPFIYRRLNKDYDAQYNAYINPSDEAELDVEEDAPLAEAQPVQMNASNARTTDGFPVNRRAGFGRR